MLYSSLSRGFWTLLQLNQYQYITAAETADSEANSD